MPFVEVTNQEESPEHLRAHQESLNALLRQKKGQQRAAALAEELGDALISYPYLVQRVGDERSGFRYAVFKEEDSKARTLGSALAGMLQAKEK
ncbi:MAG: hypothetical protein MK135_03535 [Polyangiaceae bacterium]|nr:hypothetical protein [Polyangiaceae bacterium]